VFEKKPERAIGQFIGGPIFGSANFGEIISVFLLPPEITDGRFPA
jgi:hypothetical protein